MIVLNAEATKRLGDELRSLFDSAPADFSRARELAPFLGVHLLEEDRARMVFWTPDARAGSADGDSSVTLRLYRLKEFSSWPTEGNIRFTVTSLSMETRGEFAYAVVDGLRFGNEASVGDLYELSYSGADGNPVYEPDPLAWSVPYGGAAPGELFDVQGMLAKRTDSGYFAPELLDDEGRVSAPAYMMEIHPGTASPDGSFAGLADIYTDIGGRIRGGEPLDAWQQAYAAYDAIQLMPIEPTIGYEGGPAYWTASAPEYSGEIEVAAKRPDGINWGYDSLISGSPAPQPSYLRSGRPNELLSLIETLHSFPGGGIKVVLDVVYGHLDNQSLDCMNSRYFAGPNMYGQDFRYRDPMVRIMVLEMLRRKSSYGIDGIRVDGAQDFKFWNEDTQSLEHDDDLLELMNSIRVKAGNLEYIPWMIFEDGRPWPREDWELASTYREITRRLTNVYQWGPLTFAHNTPFLFTFWVSKWWRIQELCKHGGRWITGTSNHDTLRRGTQVHPESRMNTYLGNDLPEIFARGYDSAAAHLFDTIMPGIPMDFLQANLRVPWSFIRNTDRRWAPKVMAEEAFFLDWALRDDRYRDDWVFPRLKKLGFASLSGLKTFCRSLANCLEVSEFQGERTAKLMNRVEPSLQGPTELDGDTLVEIGRRWMEDVRDFCSVHHWKEAVETAPIEFAGNLRRLRIDRRWLMESMGPQDLLLRWDGARAAIVIAVYRRNPAGTQSALMVANMEGAQNEVSLDELQFPEHIRQDLREEGWTLAAASPGLRAPAQPKGRVELENASGALWTRG
jgi:hypothetical protein